MGSTMTGLYLLTNFMLIFSSLTLFFVKNKTRLGKLRLKNSYVSVLEHLSTPCFFSFEMSSQIVRLVSAFVYLRFSESYMSEVEIMGGTRLWSSDMFLCLFCILSTFFAGLSLFITASNQEWWGLAQKLKVRRPWYAIQHHAIMNRVGSEERKRAELNNLEHKFNEQEDRFDEMRQFIGQV